jgi:hypothetical protein
MGFVQCPACQAKVFLTHDGACPSCRAQVAAATSAPEPVVERREPVRPAFEPPERRSPAVKPAVVGPCDLCGRDEPVSEVTLQLTRLDYWILFVMRRAFFVQTACCEECRAKVRRLGWQRTLRALAQLAVLFVAVLALITGWALAASQFPRGAPMQFVLIAVMLATMIGIMSLHIVLLRRRAEATIKNMLGAENDQRLRAQFRLQHWGLGDVVEVKSHQVQGRPIPRAQAFPASQVASTAGPVRR